MRVRAGVNVRGEEPEGRERRFKDLGWCVVSSEPAYGFKRSVWGSGNGVECGEVPGVGGVSSTVGSTAVVA